jgi:hypothetical protein
VKTVDAARFLIRLALEAGVARKELLVVVVEEAAALDADKLRRAT